MKKLIFASAALVLAATAPLSAQTTFGTGAIFQHYSLDRALGVSAAQLWLTPVAVRVPLGSALAFDVYSAWARGSADVAGATYTLDGFVDTRIRASWSLAPWAVATVGVNLPTGSSEHDGEQAIVASVMATELLGFREAGWGVGLAATTGIATAHRIGEWGLGFGASYRHATEYSPAPGAEQRYNPGDEIRLRLALDRSVGSSQFTAGVTFQNFAEDQVDGRNLFQPGSRLRGDAAWVFRVGAASIMTASGALVWRERGDLFFDVHTGQPMRETIGGQVLAVGGLGGSVPITRTFTIMPAVDARWVNRDDPGGDGWLAGGGLDIPLRVGAFHFMPGGRLRYGQLAGTTGPRRSIMGAEVAATVRWGS
jgi:hypothetical protein